MRKFVPTGFLLGAISLSIAGLLTGCSVDQQLHAQEAVREAPKGARRAAENTAREAHEVVARATGSAVDLALAAKVKGALMLHRRLHADAIDVGVEERVVHLRGVVPSARERRKAIEMARDVPGVRDVVSKLKVDRDAAHRPGD